MNRRTISKVSGVVSLFGAVASSVALFATLGKIMVPLELTVTVASIAAAVLAGISSLYLAKIARRFRSAPRVFLSYSHDDTGAARKVAEALRAHGAHVWLDMERIRPGDAIVPTIQKAIDNCDRFVVLVSRSPSPNLALEVGLARSKGVPVIPVLVADAPVPTDLQGLRYVDLRHDTSQGIEELVRAAT